jgi:hypothetical protein
MEIMWKEITVVLVAATLSITVPLTLGFLGGSEPSIDVGNMTSARIVPASPVIVDKGNPFYPLIATPVALYYHRHMQERDVAPLLVQDFMQPSEAVQRFITMYGLDETHLVAGEALADVSTRLAKATWKSSDGALLIKADEEGYQLGLAAAPLAAYLNIPIFVADDIADIRPALRDLNVLETFVCGDIAGFGITERFANLEEIRSLTLDVLGDNFGDYITMTNPLDTTIPQVLDSVDYHFEGSLNSGSTLHGLHLLLNGFNYTASHGFVVPEDYTYARIKVTLVNEDSDDVEQWGDRLFLHLVDSLDSTFEYTSTAAGIPVVSGKHITEDRLEYETVVYRQPGTYHAEVVGTWIIQKTGNYSLDVTVEKLDTSCYPLMPNLSSLAPYLTAYRRGIVWPDADFGFAATPNVTVNGQDCPGIASPVKNSLLATAANTHVMGIHQELNELLSILSGIPANNTQALREYYFTHPVHIALLGDTTMIPHYYYANPDSDYVSGIGAAGDYIYGDIDPNPADMENDTYSFYPVMENAVGRVTGYDAEDCSALIARTVGYEQLLVALDDWKETATVQTGTGIEFQKIPVVTDFMNRVKSVMGFGPVRDEPTKFWTGESRFINMRLVNSTATGGFNVLPAYRLAAQRVGLLGDLIGKAGQYQLDSNYIFAFNHGTYYLFEGGDMLEFDPFGLGLKTGLSGKGSFDVRHVVNMDYGPSMVFIESCLVGRTEGLSPYNTLSQAFIHAGVNTFIASTRYTADPGYLEPGLFFEGFGIKGYVNASLNYLRNGQFPDLHFGALIAEDYILDLINNDTTTGLALRNAKNYYLPKDANSTFLWTPPLGDNGTGERALDKKYVAIHEFVLYGDPAFNPYEPVNAE